MPTADCRAEDHNNHGLCEDQSEEAAMVGDEYFSKHVFDASSCAVNTFMENECY